MGKTGQNHLKGLSLSFQKTCYWTTETVYGRSKMVIIISTVEPLLTATPEYKGHLCITARNPGPK